MDSKEYFKNKEQLEIKNMQEYSDKIKKLIENKAYPKIFSMPLNIQFELTSKCNLKCKHCYNMSSINNSDFMTIEQWIKFAEYLVKNGGIFQAIFSGGEPLLLGNGLWDIIDIFNKDNTNICLISNGFLFKKEMLRRMINYNFNWIQISIDGFTSEKHDKFRGVYGSWKKACEAAFYISNSGIPLKIATTIIREDLEYLEDYIKMGINLGASYYIIGDVFPSGNSFFNEDIFLTPSEKQYFDIEINKLIKKYKSKIEIFISAHEKTQLHQSINKAIEGVILRPDGNIRLDCGCPFVIGNILKDDFLHVWRNKSFCWNNDKVIEYIKSCNYIDGSSNLIKNYVDKDIYIYNIYLYTYLNNYILSIFLLLQKLM